MRKSPVNQHEIARQAGVTQIAVSQVLNNKGRISPATRERVLAIAAKLGYRANGLARRVQEGRYRGLALLGSAERLAYNIHAQDFHLAIGRALAEQSWHLTEAWLPTEGLADPVIVADLLDRLLADAVIVHDVSRQSPLVEDMLARYHVPAIWVNSLRSHNVVNFADAEAASAAVEHLLAQGYRRPALLFKQRPIPEHHLSVHERERGYRAACATAGIPSRVLHPPVEEDRFDLLPNLCETFKDPALAPDALVCYTAEIANVVGLMAAKLGRRIGPDLGLIAFARADETLLDRPLTACLLDHPALGQAAVAMAWRLLAGDAPEPGVTIPLPLLRPEATTARNG